MRQDPNAYRVMAKFKIHFKSNSRSKFVSVIPKPFLKTNPRFQPEHQQSLNLTCTGYQPLGQCKGNAMQKEMSYAMKSFSTSNSRGIPFPWGNDKGASVPGFAACPCLIASLQSLGDASDREKRGVTSACQSTSNTADPAPCHGGPADETVCERQRIPISWRSIQQSEMGEKPPSQSIPWSSFHSQTTILRKLQNFSTTVEIEGGLWSPQLLAFDRPRGSTRQVNEGASLNPEPQTLTIWGNKRSPRSYMFSMIYTNLWSAEKLISTWNPTGLGEWECATWNISLRTHYLYTMWWWWGRKLVVPHRFEKVWKSW